MAAAPQDEPGAIGRPPFGMKAPLHIRADDVFEAQAQLIAVEQTGGVDGQLARGPVEDAGDPLQRECRGQQATREQ